VTRSEVRNSVQRVVENLFNLESVAENDSLCDLGIDSILMIQLRSS
jgi:aryl carrier-like protein